MRTPSRKAQRAAVLVSGPLLLAAMAGPAYAQTEDPAPPTTVDPWVYESQAEDPAPTQPAEEGDTSWLPDFEGWANWVTDSINDLTGDEPAEEPTTPDGGGDTPPAGDGDTPPAGDGETPPAGDGATPPAGDGETPPAGDGDTPPAGDGETPPAGDGETPPAGDGETPPAGDGDTPPAGDGETPPAGDGETPPADGEGPVPPAGGEDPADTTFEVGDKVIVTPTGTPVQGTVTAVDEATGEVTIDVEESQAPTGDPETPTPPADGETPPADEPGADEPAGDPQDTITAGRETVLAAANAARAEQGVPALLEDAGLQGVAQAYAEDLAARQTLDEGHVDPQGNDPFARATAAGVDYAQEEVIAYNSEGAAPIVDQWLTSTEGHREALLNPANTLVGTGVAVSADGSTYAVQLYGSSPDAEAPAEEAPAEEAPAEEAPAEEAPAGAPTGEGAEAPQAAYGN